MLLRFLLTANGWLQQAEAVKCNDACREQSRPFVGHFVAGAADGDLQLAVAIDVADVQGGAEARARGEEHSEEDHAVAVERPQGLLDAREDEAYDLDPGVHRVVLDEQSGDRAYSTDVDILENRRTVMDVTVSGFDGDYDVAVFYD